MADEVNTGRDYAQNEIRAARQVLVELAQISGDYSDGLVVIGGFAPLLQVEQSLARHLGTKDVDIAMNSDALTESAYHSIFEILMQNQYQQLPKEPFRWERRVTIQKTPVSVVVDFLTPSDGSRGTRLIQEVPAMKLEGCEVAFLDPTAIALVELGPDGAVMRAAINVVSLPMFLVLKGNAIRKRANERGRKDAYDIVYCLDYYRRHVQGGLQTLANEFLPRLSDPSVLEGLSNLRAAFAALDDTGPCWAADEFVGFRGQSDPETWEQMQRDAYEMATALFAMLGI